MEAALNGPSGRIVLGSAEITVGRLSSNQLMVNDPKASSRHATISPAGQGYSITDLGSTNGTLVNEQRLSPNAPFTLNPGDRIRVGDTTFTYEVAGAAPIAPTVYGGPGQGQGYDPTVAAASPYANNPAYLPNEAAASPYSQYEASPPPAYQSPPGYQVPPAQSPYQAPPPAYPPYGSPAQPAYGAPGPGVPGAGILPTKQSRRTLWIVLGVVGGVVIIGIIALFALVTAFASTPPKTLDTFCNAIKSRDYQTAYNQLSSFRKTKISESDFANLFTPANSCTYSTPSENGSTATTTLTFFTSSGSVDGPTNMVQENGVWKIDAINLPSQ